MTDKVYNAAGNILKYTRNDLAHERFDCDWVRDWSCMEELLTALGCSSAADSLRKFCKSKSHDVNEGNNIPNIRRNSTLILFGHTAVKTC